MKRRVALLLIAFLVAAIPARAQGPQSSLAARIAAVEARLTALETMDESDIVGTYKWASLGIELNRGFAGTPGTPARAGSSVDTVLITLNADHTVQGSSASGLTCRLPILEFGIPTCRPSEEEDPVPLTWSFANGVLTISGDPEDGPMEFVVPRNGVIVHADSSEFLPGHTWATLIVLVKQN